MSRRRQSRRGLSGNVKKQIKEEHRRLCLEGKHIWRPVFCSERIGSTPKWDGSSVYCEYCNVYFTFDKLEKAEQVLITSIAKVLTEVNERVARLHSPRTFSDAGI